LLIYDLSQIQARMANPQPKLIGSVFWRDGSAAQHTIHVKIGKKPTSSLSMRAVLPERRVLRNWR
jgi:hypothetical protein